MKTKSTILILTALVLVSGCSTTPAQRRDIENQMAAHRAQWAAESAERNERVERERTARGYSLADVRNRRHYDLTEQKRQAKRERDKQRAADYVASRPELPDHTRQLILDNWFEIGFTTEEVWAALGDPDHKTKTVTPEGWSELWTYGSKYLYFSNGVLTAYQLNQ